MRNRCRKSRMIGAMLIALLALPAIAATTYPVVWYGAVFALPRVTQQIALKAQLAQSLGKGFEVPVGGGATLKVASCNDLFAADARGLDLPGAAHEAYRYFALSCYAARAISQAQPSTTSYLRDFRLDEAATRQLPPGMWMAVSDADRARAKMPGVRLGDLSGDARYRVTDTPDSKQVEVTDAHGNNQDIAWVARGDFDHDGIEDVLLATHDTASASSAQEFQLVVVSRSAVDAPLTIVHRIAVSGPGQGR